MPGLVDVGERRSGDEPVNVLGGLVADRILMALDDQDSPIQLPQSVAKVVTLREISEQPDPIKISRST